MTSRNHPILSPLSMMREVISSGMINLSSCVNEHFWSVYKQFHENHPVFHDHLGHLGNTLPVLLHGDEGTSLKKASMMILNIQGILAPSPGSVNHKGHSFKNRFLYTVCPSALYKRDASYLEHLFEYLAADLSALYHSGVSVHGKKYWIVTLSTKGDWAYLAKVGAFTRHFGTRSSGVCHLCSAGMTPETPYEDFVDAPSWLLSWGSSPVPWRK